VRANIFCSFYSNLHHGIPEFVKVKHFADYPGDVLVLYQSKHLWPLSGITPQISHDALSCYVLSFKNHDRNVIVFNKYI
jgi:hypothetical protein